jgi:hypothetical protein
MARLLRTSLKLLLLLVIQINRVFVLLNHRLAYLLSLLMQLRAVVTRKDLRENVVLVHFRFQKLAFDLCLKVLQFVLYFWICVAGLRERTIRQSHYVHRVGGRAPSAGHPFVNLFEMRLASCLKLVVNLLLLVNVLVLLVLLHLLLFRAHYWAEKSALATHVVMHLHLAAHALPLTEVLAHHDSSFLLEISSVILSERKAHLSEIGRLVDLSGWFAAGTRSLLLLNLLHLNPWGT